MSNIYTYKIFTNNGVSKEKLFSNQKVLHLGCGKSKLEGSIGIDKLKVEGVDIIHDLDKYPWPIDDNSVDLVYAHSVLEHIDDVVSFFEECQRIGKKGTRVVIAVPYFRSIDSFGDPTHKHFFISKSLDYFIDEKNSLSNYDYIKNKFKKIGFWYGWPVLSSNLLTRMFKTFISKYPKFYDQYLSILFPVKILVWELEIKK